MLGKLSLCGLLFAGIALADTDLFECKVGEVGEIITVRFGVQNLKKPAKAKLVDVRGSKEYEPIAVEPTYRAVGSPARRRLSPQLVTFSRSGSPWPRSLRDTPRISRQTSVPSFACSPRPRLTRNRARSAFRPPCSHGTRSSGRTAGRPSRSYRS